jgi:PAS domain S-box-containing protein
MQPLMRGYETQVKVFMILVVLFLVSANLITVTFLTRSEDLLLGEARARIMAATSAIGREVTAGRLAGDRLREPGGESRVSEQLLDLARAHGASLVEVIDAEGSILVSSQSWRKGSREPLDRILDAPGLADLRAGRPAMDEANLEGDLTDVVVILPPRAGAGSAYLHAGYALVAAGAITRQIRILTWAQGIGGTLVLVMVLLFTRFVLAPYRALRVAAAGFEPGEPRSEMADDPAFLVASFRGVVEKMRAMESELERMRFSASSSGAQESLLSSLSSGVLVLDAGGRAAALNPAGESILGVAGRDVIGRRAGEIFTASPELAAILEDAARHGRGRSREVVSHRLPTGRSIHLGVTTAGPPGGGSGALCLFSDLTEIRGVQLRVLLKENLARVGELSAGIAHEFRNSLATILGYATLAAKTEPEPTGNAQAIIREVQATGRLVDEFLRYAGPARLQKSECALRPILEGLGEEVRRGLGDEVAVAIEGEWPERIAADEALLRQAFHNLLRNAVEAASSGSPPKRVVVRGRVEGLAAVVEVSDSGAGFSEEILKRLFTPFVTTKSRGTGLGMALAQKIVVSHDGSIEAANGERGGARVTVTLPLAG